MQKMIVFVFGLLLGATAVLLLHPRAAKAANSPTYISRFTGVSKYGLNYSNIVFGDVKSISCVAEDEDQQRSGPGSKSSTKAPATTASKTVCYVLSQ